MPRVGARRSDAGRRVQLEVARSPKLLQEEFIGQFESPEPWEQKLLTASVERIAALMEADAVDAAPILQVGEIDSGKREEKPANTG